MAHFAGKDASKRNVLFTNRMIALDNYKDNPMIENIQGLAKPR